MFHIGSTLFSYKYSTERFCLVNYSIFSVLLIGLQKQMLRQYRELCFSLSEIKYYFINYNTFLYMGMLVVEINW